MSSAEYKKINPRQTVPALEIDGVLITDSIATLEVYAVEALRWLLKVPRKPIYLYSTFPSRSHY